MSERTAAGPIADPRDLLRRAVALGLMGRLLGPDVGDLAEGTALAEARRTLELLGDDEGAAGLGRVAERRHTRGELAASAVHWFDHGRIPPYEYSNVGPSVGGHTAGLADVAGFYRAFGVQVRADRVDHLGTELEFLSLVTLREAQARGDGRNEEADTCAAAARSFVRDHVGRWIDVWVARIGEADPEGPWSSLGLVAARLVAGEARRHNVIPLHNPAAFEATGAPIDDDEATCEEGLISS